jgi:hypothetical protein
MDLTVKTDLIGQDKQSWLGSAAGTSNARSIVLVTASFTPSTHYPDGYFRSGTPVAKYTSGGNAGLYGPYTVGASDGTQTLAGFLLTPAKAPASTSTNVVAALLDGTGGPRVILANLPVAGIDATAQATNPHFIYV